MSLSYPHLKLPTAPETLAFRAMVTILQSDPLLKATVRAWRVWDGSSEDILDPTFATCPYLMIRPLPSQSQWETEGQHKMPLVTRIDTAVAGSNVDQLLNFWNAVRSALWPKDPARFATVRSIVLAANISRPIMTMCGYGAVLEEKGLRMLLANGKLQLNLLISTP